MTKRPTTRHRRQPIHRERGGRGLLVRIGTRLATAWVVDVVRDVVREYFDPSNLFS